MHRARRGREMRLAIIAQVQKALDGDLDRVVQIVKLTGFVNSTGDFHGPAQSHQRRV